MKMESSDISRETCKRKSPGKANIYENAAFSVATRETGQNEHMYDQLNLSTVTSGQKDEEKKNTNSPNRTTILVYSILVMLVLLYIAVIVLIVIIALPNKDKEHGGWSSWSSWGPCSVSCDVGTQHRNRSCFGLYQNLTVDHCFGESRDDRICLSGACSVQGGWSTWTPWGSCSVSCDVGTQHRNRSCNNPYQNLTVDHCFGESIDDRICLPGACSDGGWSSWSSWGTCSESCGGGIRSQTRTCTNPNPSLLGKSCDGTPIQVSVCNKQTCPDHKVAFTASGITGSSLPVFPYIIENYGNGYDSSTGRFTCKVPGIYNFAVQISKKYNVLTDFVECYIYHNTVKTVGALADPFGVSKEPDKDGYSISISGAFHLNRNDYVFIGGCQGISAVYTDNRSSFTGFLVTPDD